MSISGETMSSRRTQRRPASELVGGRRQGAGGLLDVAGFGRENGCNAGGGDGGEKRSAIRWHGLETAKDERLGLGGDLAGSESGASALRHREDAGAAGGERPAEGGGGAGRSCVKDGLAQSVV